jgi:NADH-quinone oxidoreductase subunit J
MYMQWSFENILFLILAAGAVFSAVMMITRRSPITSALFLIFNFFTVSGIYLLLKAQFIAIIQVLVYMGAIMVLFLFVIMLLNLRDESKLEEKVSYKKLTAVLLSIFLFALLGFTVYFGFAGKFTAMNPAAESIGKAEYLGNELFLKYAMPVEIAGLLLLAAVVGAVVLAKKKFEN